MPTPIIPNGSAQMAATLYTGTGSSQSVVNTVNGVSFQPDFVWTKCRNVGHNNVLQDVVRGFGSGKNLNSNNTIAEGVDNDGYPTSVNSTGFVANGGNGTNSNGNSYVAWQWKAGGAAVTNTAGSITSQVSANTTAGFSIVTWTGNGSSGSTIGHGLGAAPMVIFPKVRSRSGDNWHSYLGVLGGTQGILLNSTNAASTDSNFWNNTNPTSSVITLGTYNTFSSQTYVAYCWAPVAGYSAFGSYTGNGSTDGPFIYTGFRPRFVLTKCSGSGSDWLLIDTSRDPFNESAAFLFPNLAVSEQSSSGGMDVLSNGFKVRRSFGNINTNGITYTYMAFAENPFKYALAR